MTYPPGTYAKLRRELAEPHTGVAPVKGGWRAWCVEADGLAAIAAGRIPMDRKADFKTEKAARAWVEQQVREWRGR